jgi:hypothetical protein
VRRAMESLQTEWIKTETGNASVTPVFRIIIVLLPSFVSSFSRTVNLAYSYFNQSTSSTQV